MIGCVSQTFSRLSNQSCLSRFEHLRVHHSQGFFEKFTSLDHLKLVSPLDFSLTLELVSHVRKLKVTIEIDNLLPLLTGLTELDLRRYKKPLPLLTSLTNLTCLKVEGSFQITAFPKLRKFVGPDLRNLKKYTNLTSLDLYNNETFPNGYFPYLTNLTDLSLSNYDSLAPDFYTHLTNLSSFKVGQEISVEPLSQLRHLATLTISSMYTGSLDSLARLTGLSKLCNHSEVCAPVRELSNLTSLVSYAKVSDIDLASSLKSLTIYNNSEVSSFSRLTSLTSLELQNNTFTNADGSFSLLTNLTKLEVSNESVTSDVILQLTNLVSLRNWATVTTDECAAALAKLTKLERVLTEGITPKEDVIEQHIIKPTIYDDIDLEYY